MNICLIDVYHEFHFEVLHKLKQSNSEINFSYVVSGTPQNFHGRIHTISEWKKNIFNEDTKIDEVNRFLFPSEIIHLLEDKWSISEKIIKAFKDTETYFLRLTDRNCAFPLSVHERRQYYLILLNYFNNIVIRQKIDCLITFDTPHSFSSYLLYQVGIYHQIPVIRLEQHFLQNHSLILSHEDPELPGDYYQNSTAEELFKQLPDSVKTDLNIYNKNIKTATQKEKSAIIGTSRFSAIRLFIRFLKKALANIIMGLFPVLFKKEILHFTSLNKIQSVLYYRLAINKPLWKLLRLNHFYNKISITPDLSENFIFYGMHMQPEKTSQPLGGEYDHQLLPIIILAKSLPPGWFLYVKEHPNQFNERKISNKNFRDKSFYQAVLKLKNVRFISLQVSSAELIENSQIVSTLTGTAGWEGLLRKKPVIAFGNPYYKACRAVRSPDSVDACKKSISELLSLSKNDITKEIYRYLLYFSEKNHLVISSNWESSFGTSDYSREEQISNLAYFLQRKINTIKEKKST